ncbi:MAG: LamG domain-containing protein [Candidatus Marinimicrobia bacterium]|nr:LamG domain-containing protein [Candidatus Neomarinimicrobiota bacterium]
MMHRSSPYRIRNLLLGVILAAAFTSGWAQTPPRPGTQPAFGLLDLDEGTIECAIRLSFDPHTVPGGHVGYGSIFRFSTGDAAFPQDGLTMSLHSRNGGAFIRVQFTSSGRAVANVLNIGIGRTEQAGEWMHIALTWSRAERLFRAYVNGRPSGSRAFLSGLDLDAVVTSRATMTIGPEGGDRKNFEVGAVRISRIQRTPDDLAAAPSPLRADAQTLWLLDEAGAVGGEQ